MPSQELFEDLQDDDNMSHECGEVCIALFWGGVKIFFKKIMYVGCHIYGLQ